jgi:hypothetical protein
MMMNDPADREYLLRKLLLATAIYQPTVKLNLSPLDIVAEETTQEMLTLHAKRQIGTHKNYLKKIQLV